MNLMVQLYLKKTIFLSVAFILTFFNANSQVWPADANNNGIVNNVDFIFTGLVVGTGGPSRLGVDQGIDWSEKPANDWLNSFTSLGINHKHADANGDGWIDGADLYSINQYYDTTNTNFTSKLGNVILGNDLYLTFSDTIIEAGDTVHVKINLGTASNPISNLHGIAFSVNLDTSKIQEFETTINFHGGWLGTPNTDLYVTDKYNPSVNPNRADFAASRGDFGVVSGFGEIGEIIVITEDDLAGKMQDIVNSIQFEFENVLGIDSIGEDMLISSKNDIINVSDGIVENNFNIQFNPKMLAFPNPVKHSLFIPNIENIEKLELYTLLGKKVNVKLKNKSIDVSYLNKGVYQLLIQTNTGSETQTIVIVK